MKKPFFNRALRILLFTNGLVLLAGAMFGPITALFVTKVGGNLLDASITGCLFAFAAAITTLVAGKLADKKKRDELIVALGYSLMGAGFFLYIFVDSVIFLFLVQLLMGSSEALYSPAFDALFSKHTTKKKAGREWAAWEAMNYISIAVGSIVGGLIVTFFGFNGIFLVMSLLCFISSIYIVYLHKNVL